MPNEVTRVESNAVAREEAGAKPSAELHQFLSLAQSKGRDEGRAKSSALMECANPKMAEVATYAYRRGDTTVTGPSIHLALALKRAWGHLQSGWRELERDAENHQSTVEAVCWDAVSNNIEVRRIVIRHVRKVGQGMKVLTDARDINEHISSWASRAEREVVLKSMPRWFVDSAMEACKKTISEYSHQGLASARAAKAIKAFAAIKVNQTTLEGYIGAPVKDWSHEDLDRLQEAFQAIKDQEQTAAELFGGEKPAETTTADLADMAKAAKEPKDQRYENVITDLMRVDSLNRGDAIAKFGKDFGADLDKAETYLNEQTKE